MERGRGERETEGKREQAKGREREREGEGAQWPVVSVGLHGPVGWGLQYTLAEAQTRTLVQTQAHGVHMHAERTDTGTCARSTDACRTWAKPLHGRHQRAPLNCTKKN